MLRDHSQRYLRMIRRLLVQLVVFVLFELLEDLLFFFACAGVKGWQWAVDIVVFDVGVHRVDVVVVVAVDGRSSRRQEKRWRTKEVAIELDAVVAW